MDLAIRDATNMQIPTSIFRAYDIRGIVDETLTPTIIYTIGQAIAAELKDRKRQNIIVARDGRLSGPILMAALIDGLRASGCNVVDIGAVPTPVLYFATHFLPIDSGIMLTGSHNPANYNGLKIVLAGETLADNAIYALYQRILAENFVYGQGKLAQEDIIPHYLKAITKDIKLKHPLKVVVDSGHGITGSIAPLLYRQLGCEVIELFCHIDGNFPAHHPDPSQPENLQDLITAVTNNNADIGLAFDGDGDRLGVITNKGDIIWPDRQLMLFAGDVLQKHKAATIIFDVKCTRHLAKFITMHGGIPIMWKTGHSFIKNKMRESSALLAGEMSGHIFFKDRWLGFDDGLYAGARLLEIVSQHEKLSAIFNDIPNSYNTPELKIAIADDEKFQFLAKLKTNMDLKDGIAHTIDGIRIEFTDGFGLVRCSNTTPHIVLRFEADNMSRLEEIKQLFQRQLLKCDESMLLD